MNEYKYSSEFLKQLQNLSLGEKILLTQTRIIEFYEYYKGQVYVSFSGGKDSTVLLDIVRKIYPDLPAVFIDTGLEYPEIKEFVKSKDIIIIIRPEKSFRQVIAEYGYPLLSKENARNIEIARRNPDGKVAEKFILNSDYHKKYPKYTIARWTPLKNSDIPISAKCCDIMKKDPAHKYNKQTGKYPITAIMAEESNLRKSHWQKYGCNIYTGKYPISNPMSFWTEQDVLQYIHDNKLLYASVYGDIKKNHKKEWITTGCSRTGCIFCLFGAHLETKKNSRLIKLSKSHPQLFNYCMKSWDEGGLGMKELIDRFNNEFSTERTHIWYEE